MKKITVMFVAITLLLTFLAGCGSDEAPEEIIKGYKDSKTFSDGSEADSSVQEFSKYIYDESYDKKFAGNDDYTKVDSKNIDEISGFVENFDSWAELSSFSDDYDFSKESVTEGDYYVIADSTTSDDNVGQRKERRVYRAYSIYYYDTETHTLYYIHCDIT